ncbi:MAG: nuclear transport factor 2 family protein [Rubrivivax sp.]|nr:MAG: nuclear transport factor 2 family protein [Rubrivivax sp.]
MSAVPDFAGVTAVLQTYFDGLHDSDTQRLRSVFHPQAHYCCATDGALRHLGMAQYFAIVDQRPSPKAQGHPRADRILSIEFAGDVTAFAKVECAIPPKSFTDFLTLLCLDGRWQIISKVFHFELMPAEEGLTGPGTERPPRGA